MLQDAKAFSNAVIKSLDELGVPHDKKERSAALVKMTNITRQQAWALLDGHSLDMETARHIAKELEIDIQRFIKL
ncbi:MAG: hypothetical protein SFW66_05110 [Gammaproteobacteria bacterium]|nr:hypothetical protein [Gammaproteobacteria bacterium]